jgi:hypoxanthine phosphoribosyltransferase
VAPIDEPTVNLHDGIARIVVSRERIAARVAELGEQIARDYRARPLTIAALMTGSVIFVADLIRRLPMPMRIHLVGFSSYPGAATESQGVRVLWQAPENLAGQHVLVVDDILDSGRTLAAAIQQVRQSGADDVKSCVLVCKPAAGRAPDGLSSADYVGFDIPDDFVVGYGLDYGDYYRNLPDIAVLKEGVTHP